MRNYTSAVAVHSTNRRIPNFTFIAKDYGKWLNATIIVLFTFTCSAQAQPFTKGVIKGAVENEQHAAVPNATIILRKAADSAVYRTAFATDKGTFAFNSIAEGSYFIEITGTGFEKIVSDIIQINAAKPETDLGVLTFKNYLKVLTGVTVKSQPPLIERKIDRTVVNIENSITSEGSTALEVMQKLPGVQVTEDGAITLNGKSGVNVFIDGKATYLTSAELANLLRGMSSSAIQKIEIMTKPSAKFDASGTGGVINIVKKRNRKEGLNGTVTGGFGWGNYARYNTGISMSYKNKGYNLFTNLAYLYNKTIFKSNITSDVYDPLNNLYAEQISQNSTLRAPKSFTPSAGIEFYLSPRTTLSLAAGGSIQVAKNKISSFLNDLDGNRVKTGTLDFVNNIKERPFNYTTSLRIVHQLDTTGKELSFDFDYSKYRSRVNQDITKLFYDATGGFSSRENSLLNQNRYLYIYAGRADYIHPLKGNSKLEAGWKSSYVKADNDDRAYKAVGSAILDDTAASNRTLNEENINALYINLTKEYKKLTLQAGLRAEHVWSKGRQLRKGEEVKQNYVQLFPSLYLDYKINDNHGINIKLVRRTDRAAYSQLNPFRRPLSPTLYFQGNPDLKPQISINTEIAYSYKNSLFLTFGYDFFHDYIGTVPYLDTNNVTITRKPTNLKGGRSFNIDIGYSKKLKEWWSVNASLTIYRQSFAGTIGGFVLDNSGILSANFNYNNSFTISKNLSAETDFQYVSKHRVIATTFGGYYILSLGMKQKLFKTKGTLSLKANNILQSEDESSYYEYKRLYQNWRIFFNSRLVSMSFSYRFGKGKTKQIKSGQGSEDEQRRTR